MRDRTAMLAQAGVTVSLLVLVFLFLLTACTPAADCPESTVRFSPNPSPAVTTIDCPREDSCFMDYRDGGWWLEHYANGPAVRVSR